MLRNLFKPIKRREYKKSLRKLHLFLAAEDGHIEIYELEGVFYYSTTSHTVFLCGYDDRPEPNYNPPTETDIPCHTLKETISQIPDFLLQLGSYLYCSPEIRPLLPYDPSYKARVLRLKQLSHEK